MTRELYRPITSIILHKYTQTEMNSPSCHRPLGRFRHAASQSKLPLLFFFSMTRTEPRPVWTTVLPHTVRAPLTTQPEAGRPWSGDLRDLPPDSLDVKDGDGLEVAAPTCPNTGKPASPSWTSGQRHQASQGSGHACPFSSPLSAPCTSRSIPLAARDPLLCQLGDPSLSWRSKPGPRPPRGPLLCRWRPA